MDLLEWLQEWYKSNCDGDWEHYYGVKIDTLDNPGWSITINLNDTLLENKKFETLQVYKSDNDWIYCSLKENSFRGGGDSNKLKEIIKIFKKWVES